MRVRRRAEDLVDAEIVGDAVDLVHELLARLIVIDLMGAGDRLIAIESIEHLQIGRDGPDIAGGDALRPRAASPDARRSNCSFAWSAPLSTDRFCKTSETICRMRVAVQPSSAAISS